MAGKPLGRISGRYYSRKVVFEREGNLEAAIATLEGLDKVKLGRGLYRGELEVSRSGRSFAIRYAVPALFFGSRNRIAFDGRMVQETPGSVRFHGQFRLPYLAMGILFVSPPAMFGAFVGPLFDMYGFWKGILCAIGLAATCIIGHEGLCWCAWCSADEGIQKVVDLLARNGYKRVE